MGGGGGHELSMSNRPWGIGHDFMIILIFNPPGNEFSSSYIKNHSKVSLA